MKKRLSLLLVMVMALTMVIGTGVCAWADDTPLGSIDYVSIVIPTPVAGQSSFEYVDSIDDFSAFASNRVAVNLEHTVVAGVKYSRVDGTPVSLVDGQSYTLTLQLQTSYAEGFANDSGSWTGFLDSSIPYNAINLLLDGYGKYTSIIITYNFTVGAPASGSSSSESSTLTDSHAHVHNFQYGVIYPATKDADGLEGEMCSCGAVRNTQPISAMAYALYDYALPMINAAKPGQTITFEFGEWNSFPKAFMEKLVSKSAQGVTFVFHYKWNHVKQEITIPAGTPIDLNFDYYGPAKMAELYGAY